MYFLRTRYFLSMFRDKRPVTHLPQTPVKVAHLMTNYSSCILQNAHILKQNTACKRKYLDRWNIIYAAIFKAAIFSYYLLILTKHGKHYTVCDQQNLP